METYTLLKDLVALSKPKEKIYVYEELKGTLLRHLKPRRLVILERFSRKQGESETVTQFSAGSRDFEEGLHR